MQRIDVDTDRLRTSCWVSGPEGGVPVLLLHGNLVSGRFWKAVADRLPDDVRIVAPDFRGFGHTEAKPIDATRGLDDWIDDTTALVKALGWSGKPLHIGGWSMGGGVAMGYAVKHPHDVASLTLVAPMSPYGFGATRDTEGTLTSPDAAGCGGLAVNPDFVRRMREGRYIGRRPGLVTACHDDELFLVAEIQGAGRGRAAGRDTADENRRRLLSG